MNRHYRNRQDNLQLERNLIAQDWSKRVNFSLLELYILDAKLLYSESQGEARHLFHSDFCSKPAVHLIDKT